MPKVGNKYSMEVSVFDGGLNTETPEENMAWNQSPSMRMVVFDTYGAIKSRAGIKTYNTQIMGPNTALGYGIDGSISYKPSSMSALLLGVNQSVYVATGTATAFNQIASSESLFTNGVACDIVQFQELAIFSNGGQQPYKFNGVEFTRAGVSAPTQNITAVCDAAGALTGTYQYVFWGVNSYAAEGDYGTPSTAVTIASGRIRLNNIPTAPISHGISYWKVGRNTAEASGVFWYLTDVTNGVTSYTDSVADSSLVTEAPTDQGYLRNFKFMCVYANRLWGATEDDSLLWFSNTNQPEEFPSTNFVRVGRGDGLQISAIHPFKGTIVISKADFNGRTALYQLIIGDSVSFSDPENWNLVKLYNYGGSEAHRACVDYSDYMTTFNREGLYAFNGSSFAAVSNPTQNGAAISETLSQNISSLIPVTSVTNGVRNLRYSAAINWKEAIWLNDAAAYTSSSSVGGYFFQFDYSRISDSSRKGGAWTSLTGDSTPPAQQLLVHEGQLLGTAFPDGRGPYFYKLESGNINDSSDQLQYETPKMSGLKGHEAYFKDFRHIYLTCSGQGTLNIRASLDGFATSELNTITLSSSSTRTKLNLGSTKGKFIQLLFSMDFGTGDNVTITRLEILYNLRGLRT